MGACLISEVVRKRNTEWPVPSLDLREKQIESKRTANNSRNLPRKQQEQRNAALHRLLMTRCGLRAHKFVCCGDRICAGSIRVGSSLLVEKKNDSSTLSRDYRMRKSQMRRINSSPCVCPAATSAARRFISVLLFGFPYVLFLRILFHAGLSPPKLKKMTVRCQGVSAMAVVPKRELLGTRLVV